MAGFIQNAPRDMNGDFVDPATYGTGSDALRTYECIMGTRRSEGQTDVRMMCRPAPQGCSNLPGTQCLTINGDPPPGVVLSNPLLFDVARNPHKSKK